MCTKTKTKKNGSIIELTWEQENLNLSYLDYNVSKYTSLIGVRNGESGDQVPVGHHASLFILSH